jgi:hypothetical protein
MDQPEKTILDQFEYKTVQFHSERGVENVSAWCYGEIGICLYTKLDDVPVWTLFSVPRGLAFPHHHIGVYEKVENAAQAALDMAKAKNNWSGLSSFNEDAKKIMKTICAKNGGSTSFGPSLTEIKSMLDPNFKYTVERKPFLNGKREDYT